MVTATVARRLPLLAGLILIACLACSSLPGVQEPREPTWVSVQAGLYVRLVPPGLDQPGTTLNVSSFLGSSNCNRYDYQGERDGTKINVTWSQYAFVGEEIACTLDRGYAYEAIPLDTGHAPG